MERNGAKKPCPRSWQGITCKMKRRRAASEPSRKPCPSLWKWRTYAGAWKKIEKPEKLKNKTVLILQHQRERKRAVKRAGTRGSTAAVVALEQSLRSDSKKCRGPTSSRSTAICLEFEVFWTEFHRTSIISIMSMRFQLKNILLMEESKTFIEFISNICAVDSKSWRARVLHSASIQPRAHRRIPRGATPTQSSALFWGFFVCRVCILVHIVFVESYRILFIASGIQSLVFLHLGSSWYSVLGIQAFRYSGWVFMHVFFWESFGIQVMYS